ncbi:uncharacterized protein G2W53_004924 [Senna tora]|uniref:Uncharacterized protein n=1 Tax=Senna tora TaxID=362788 RepID=A0A835CIL6_9FABA|nr:uncharacterized protein G2W53_004924 [Senna tora]
MAHKRVKVRKRRDANFLTKIAWEMVPISICELPVKEGSESIFTNPNLDL